MTDAAPLPWMHPTLAAAAKALGVSVRTLEQWKTKGAPLVAAPVDELALRLWHCAFAVQSHGKARTLAAPTGHLMFYIDQITTAIAAHASESATAHRDPARLVKARQAERLGLQNARSKSKLLVEAQTAFATYCGALEKHLARVLTTGTALETVWKACQNASRLQAEGTLGRLIASQITTSIRQTLDQVCNPKGQP